MELPPEEEHVNSWLKVLEELFPKLNVADQFLNAFCACLSASEIVMVPSQFPVPEKFKVA